MKKLTFKCKLLTDVILNQSAATVGNQQTLDFIPGNNFLGIAAGVLYKDSNDTNLTIFHSGNVRFGDAHPAEGNLRSLKIPASIFYPKLLNLTDECYVNYGYNREQDSEKKQLKQCRNGFYIFNVANDTAKEIKTIKTFAMKSAYDSKERRSKDAQMYGYQSLGEGQSFIFDVELTDDAESFADDIKKALLGEKRIGRSRTAQYGLVYIDFIDDEIKEYSTCNAQNCVSGNEVYTVYADSRLIFLDQNSGMPTFRPNVTDLGFKTGDIDWEYSQIRTFQYSPWNFTRQSRDTDRCGIEKGSIFVIKGANQSPSKSCYVGSYKNEGFGHIIYNPAFLNFDRERNGKATCNFIKEEEVVNNSSDEDKKKIIEKEFKTLLGYDHNLLLQYLGKEKKEELFQNEVYSRVNKFAQDYKAKFHGEKFASQWGTVRSIASNNKGKDNIINEVIEKYTSHGIAKDQWNKKKRRDVLLEFIKETQDEYTQMAVINLAAEMAKLANN